MSCVHAHDYDYDMTSFVRYVTHHAAMLHGAPASKAAAAADAFTWLGTWLHQVNHTQPPQQQADHTQQPYTLLRIAKAGSTTTLNLIADAKKDNPRACTNIEFTPSHTRSVQHRGIIVMREPSERFFSAYDYSYTNEISRHGERAETVLGWAHLLQANATLRAYWLAAPTHSPAWKTDRHTKAGYGRYVCEYDSAVVTRAKCNRSNVVTRAKCNRSNGHYCGFVPQADYYVSGETRVLCLPSEREGMQRLLNGIARGCKLRPHNLTASEITRYAQHSLTGGVKVVASDDGGDEDEDVEDDVDDRTRSSVGVDAAELRRAVASLYPRDYMLWQKYCVQSVH